MERERGILCRILTISAVLPCLSSCIENEYREDMSTVEIHFTCMDTDTKAEMPDENKVNDVNLMIFDEYGVLEKHMFMENTGRSCTVSLLKGVRYTISACVNFGYEVKADNIEALKDIVFYMAYPDEYRGGMPMAGLISETVIHEDCSIDMELERLMAKIGIRMDRSRLSDGVEMNVTSIRIGNCPKKVHPFTASKVKDEDDCFKVGFRHDDIECLPLNKTDMYGLSGTVSLYMLENMQGQFSDDCPDGDTGKVFVENDPRKATCSYIEVELEYTFGDYASMEQPLIYRFYLGEDLNSLNVERNCNYLITIAPEDDGLKGDGWRVDKSGIVFVGMPEIVQYPGDYIRGDIGDVIHIGCMLKPSNAPFDIGIEYLEADKATGIYDYEIDADGHGVTLTLKKSGRGLIYMEAGEPINDAALFLIEVNL